MKKNIPMNEEHVKGATDKAKGVIKETVGKVTGDKHLQAEGKMGARSVRRRRRGRSPRAELEQALISAIPTGIFT
jgi:hypothetical protein